MTNNKIAFIMCTNNEIMLEECINYLNMLIVPDGYSTELITITDASSMTAGYNEAMTATDAAIKIYMHQDLFIINRNFLCDIVSIFETDERIGLIGMVGYKNVPKTGTMWYEKRYGCVTMYGTSDKFKGMSIDAYEYKLSDGVESVAVCDGCLLITSKDIRWDEETFDGWDFYDADQCIHFLENGYRVVVPTQKYPWYLHDDGKYLTMFNYKKYRKRFMDKYERYLGKSYSEVPRL